MEWLIGKRTMIGGAIVALIGAVWSLDQLVPGEWFPQSQYEAFGAFVAGLTGYTFSLAMKDAMDQRAKLGSLAVSLIGLVWTVDQLAPGQWFTDAQYEGVGTIVSGLTGVAFRIGLRNAMGNVPNK